MKILYAIQGTGNGHLTRAQEIIPHLQNHGELDLLVSGCQVDLQLPHPIKYRLGGMSFIFGKSGGIDFISTFNQLNSRRFYAEIRKFPINSYDLVISDFEPVSAWACMLAKKSCIGLSNQCATLLPQVPRPLSDDKMGKLVLRNYAPVTHAYGFHFARFSSNIYTPIIRKEVRQLQPQNHGHYTVYLPAYSDEKLIKQLARLPQVQWQIFSKHNKKEFLVDNVWVRPVQPDAFLQSMASSAGVLCAAGFGTAAEALYLQKKLVVIPMKNQYEQHCNAAALQALGVPVLPKLKKKYLPELEDWITNGRVISVDYPDETEQIVKHIVSSHT